MSAHNSPLRTAGITLQEELDQKALEWSNAHRTTNAKGQLLTRFAAVAYTPREVDCGEVIVHVEAVDHAQAGAMVLGVVKALYPDAPAGFNFDYYNCYSERQNPSFVLRMTSSQSATDETYDPETRLICFTIQPPPFRMSGDWGL